MCRVFRRLLAVSLAMLAVLAMPRMAAAVDEPSVPSAVDVTNYRAEDGSAWIQVCIDGEELVFLEADGAGLPFIDENNRLQIPVRRFAEALGANVWYRRSDRTITIARDDTTILFQLDSSWIYCNGEVQEMDTAARLVSGRTYIPLRAAAEALDCTVTYAVEEAVSPDLRVDREDVAWGFYVQNGDAPWETVTDADHIRLSEDELDRLVELYNQMCMGSPRSDLDVAQDTLGTYTRWVYLTLEDGQTLDLCRRGMVQIRGWLGTDPEGFLMESLPLYTFLSRLSEPDWMPTEA